MGLDQDMSRIGRLARNNTVFLLCDVQERFRGVVHDFPSLVYVCDLMTKGAGALGVPILVTEQYPKGLLHTVPEIDLTNKKVYGPIAKTKFSMFVSEVQEIFAREKFQNAVLFGLETHVCVQQTALDLLAHHINVHVLVDGVASRSTLDRDVALERMRQSGAFLTTAESALMELVGGKDESGFKEISNLVKQARPAAKM
eukprot:c25944_g1_i1.p1 GENE.c25944_g1_i1~~c25944_g1_i1.p1  ORF type:complete len:199 (-),score=37.94 c25944_g1_i1:1-597(-)